MNEEVLYHHGIKGMKWGVRRSESQLAAVRGKKTSSGKSSSTSKKKSKTTKASKKKTEVDSYEKKLSSMSDDELRNAVQRMNLERSYREMNPKKVSAGKKFVQKMMKDAVVPAVTDVTKNLIKTVLTDAVNSSLKKAASSTKKKK